ncbi:MAG: hypothetical protein HKN46_00220 [Acidimicrobiia bacterium]|nr:hypothetical protein [Acidimicrobiia bacterium]
MPVLLIVASLFLILEVLNVVLLTFDPGSRRGNALGVFRAWESTEADPAIHNLLRYLAAWVAASKLIFVLVVGMILVFGDDRSKVIAVGALALGVLAYFWRLRPLLNTIDASAGLEPAGYSRRLTAGITVIAIALAAGFVSGLSSL